MSWHGGIGLEFMEEPRMVCKGSASFAQHFESNLHWQLAVSFREDECRVCRDHAPANLSVIRRFALGLLKRETSCRKGIEIKRMKCAGNDDYREKVLFKC
jgi:hypothetical protein